MEDSFFTLIKFAILKAYNVMVCRRQSFFFTFPGFCSLLMICHFLLDRRYYIVQVKIVLEATTRREEICRAWCLVHASF